MVGFSSKTIFEAISLGQYILEEDDSHISLFISSSFLSEDELGIFKVFMFLLNLVELGAA
jgi:hypothetical protein